MDNSHLTSDNNRKLAEELREMATSNNDYSAITLRMMMVRAANRIDMLSAELKVATANREPF